MPYIIDYGPIAVITASGLVAWGDLRARVSRAVKDIDTKASRELLDAHYQEILARLDRIERNQNGKHAEDA